MVQVSWHFDKEASFHPHIITRLESIQEKEDPNCWFDIIYQLPASVFVDPNQVDSNVYVFGETDLEAPLEHVKEPRGSTIIIRQKKTKHDSQDEKNEQEENIIDLPIHLRYQRPSSNSETHRSIKILKPRAGWTCLLPTNDKQIIEENGPWIRNENRVLLPPLQEGNILIPMNNMDPSKTSFQDVLVKGKEDYLLLNVPIGRIQDLDRVQMGTMVAVITCTLWIILATWKSITKRRRYDAKGKRRRSE